MKPLQAAKRSFRGSLVLLTGVVLGNGICCDAYAQNAAQPGSKSSAAAPFAMIECEQWTEGCATWTFLGPQGIGELPSGEEVSLTYSINGDKIIFIRAHSKGPLAGLRVTYTGTADKDGISGKFETTGNGQNKSGNWYSYETNADSRNLPSVMRMCIAPAYNLCWTWTWSNGHYDGIMSVNNGAGADGGTMMVESFTPRSVVLRMKQSGVSAVIKGKISSEGNTIVNADWSNSKGQAGLSTISWGTALNMAAGCCQPQQQPTPYTLGDVVNGLKVIDLGLEMVERLKRLTSQP
jgi:hypothetical protein